MLSATARLLKSIWQSHWFNQLLEWLTVLLFLAMLLSFALLLTVPSLAVGEAFVSTANGTTLSQRKN
jgi:hypothetical protein